MRSRRPLHVAVLFILIAITGSALAQHRLTPLEASVLNAMRNARFDQSIDYGPYAEACPGRSFCPVPALPVAHMPNVDVAVIELDARGRNVSQANVLLSRNYPAGLVVPLDAHDGASSVRFRRWDIQRSDGGTFSSANGKQLTVKGWTDNPEFTAADDIVPGREGAHHQFMSPYPASLFKIIVAYHTMRLVDQGLLTLDSPYTYQPEKHDVETRSVRAWMDPMITISDNRSTRALLKQLHDLGEVGAMNQELRSLGLGTLQINGTSPSTGGQWNPGQIHMTAYDTARLFWIIAGGEGTMWRRPDGRPVTAAELSAASRNYLLSLLLDQGFHEALSTTNFCGAANIQAGIPALVPARWINADGTVTVDGYYYGQDVRPCNAAAEVTFAHKTGLTFNYASDAGIVQSRAGQPHRRYIIAFLANQGYRYTDPVFASRTINPCYDAVGSICYTQRIPQMARQIDDGLK